MVSLFCKVMTMTTTTAVMTAEQRTAAIAKALLPLKKAAGLASIRQNYKGTGSQKARRQLWIALSTGSAVDLWLDADSFTIGGVTQLRIAGRWAYGDQTPAAIAGAIADLLKTLS
jgi:hypothetical protein